MAAITLERLTVGYGEKAVIQDFSLTIEDGSLFTLLGPSGCGKTTLLRTMAGFIAVRSGRVLFGDRDVTHTPPHQRDVGMVFQDYALFPDKTVFDNVAYGLRARKQDAAAIVRTVSEYLDRVGLLGFESRRPAELSGGQRQRVALARALAIRPSVLLMDEPLSNLDAKLRLQVRETISDLQREIGITTVLVTHDQEEALALSNRIGLVREGALAQVGTPRELYARPNSTYVADFVGAANAMPVQLVRSTQPDASVRVNLEGQEMSATAGQALAQGPAVLLVRSETLSLCDQPGDNRLPVRILRSQYLGARTLISVRSETGTEWRVELHGTGSDRWAVGARAFLQLDAVSSRVVAS